MKHFIISFILLAIFAPCFGIENSKCQVPEQNQKAMVLNIDNFRWTRQPKSCTIKNDTIEVVTRPRTDLWQRTYYHFRNDNAPVFQMETEEKFFSFVVKTDFTGSHHRFDQCGIVMYLDSENWLKGSVEYENEEFQHLVSFPASAIARARSLGVPVIKMFLYSSSVISAWPPSPVSSALP